jgi:hypothetical protein
MHALFPSQIAERLLRTRWSPLVRESKAAVSRGALLADSFGEASVVIVTFTGLEAGI